MWPTVALLALATPALAAVVPTLQQRELASPIGAAAWANGDLFTALGKAGGTDKAHGHAYNYLYSRHLERVRFSALNLLEIGLGCGMAYGPAGGSVRLWQQYLPNSNLSFVEMDESCAQPLKDTIERDGRGRLYTGDQTDEALLQRIVADSQRHGGYDIIIDDGGHADAAVSASFQVLWAALKPGGAYCIEDVYFHYREGERAFAAVPGTFMHTLKRAIDRLHCRSTLVREGEGFSPTYMRFCAEQPLDVVTVDCIPEACLLIKGHDLHTLTMTSR